MILSVIISAVLNKDVL